MKFRWILFILITLFYFSSVFFGMKKAVVGETPCFDGYGQKNLEGFMCEKSETTYFGYPEYYVIFPLFLLIIVLVWILKDEVY